MATWMLIWHWNMLRLMQYQRIIFSQKKFFFFLHSPLHAALLSLVVFLPFGCMFPFSPTNLKKKIMFFLVCLYGNSLLLEFGMLHWIMAWQRLSQETLSSLVLRLGDAEKIQNNGSKFPMHFLLLLQGFSSWFVDTAT